PYPIPTTRGTRNALPVGDFGAGSETESDPRRTPTLPVPVARGRTSGGTHPVGWAEGCFRQDLTRFASFRHVSGRANPTPRGRVAGAGRASRFSALSAHAAPPERLTPWPRHAMYGDPCNAADDLENSLL